MLLQVARYMLLLLPLMACEDDVPEPDNTFNASENKNRTILAEVRHIYDFPNGLDSMVAGATVLLYSDRDVFVTAGIAEKYRTTDSTGKVIIEFLDQSYYWIRTVHPDLGEVLDSVSTPEYTSSFVFIDYL